MFYSILNFALCLPLLVPITFKNFPTEHPLWFALGFLVVLLVGPIAWPLILCKVMRSTKLMKGLQLPFPTAWDAFFNRRQECFMIIHLKNGGIIAGYYGPDSYATSFPREGELYVCAVYTLDDDGHFSNPIPDTRGLLIRKDEYSYIELFDVPQQTKGDTSNVQGQGNHENG
jgi:hypothetical protein